MQPKQVTINSLRYFWSKPSDLPERVELIDKITSHPAAVIHFVNRRYQWKRTTSELIHGAPPAEGHCDTLMQAKISILDGLKNEM